MMTTQVGDQWHRAGDGQVFETVKVLTAPSGGKMFQLANVDTKRKHWVSPGVLRGNYQRLGEHSS